MVGNLTELETRNASGTILPALTQGYGYNAVNRRSWTRYDAHDRIEDYNTPTHTAVS